MTPRVYELLMAQYEAASRPVAGWIFPHPSRARHYDGHAAKEKHARDFHDSGVQPGRTCNLYYSTGSQPI